MQSGSPVPLPCPLPVRPAPGTGRPQSGGSLQTYRLPMIPAHTRGPSCPLQEPCRFPMMHACMMCVPARPGCGVHEQPGPCCMSEGAAECTCGAIRKTIRGSDHAWSCMLTAMRMLYGVTIPRRRHLALVNALVARRQLLRSMRAGNAPSAITRSEGDRDQLEICRAQHEC